MLSKEILETIFSHQTSFIYILDTNLRVTFASKPLLKFMSRTESEVMGKTVEEIGYEPHTAAKLQKLFASVLAGNVENGEDHFVSVNGVHTFFEYNFAPVKDAAGKVISISAMSRDISDRKRMELELIRNIAELQKEREMREAFIMAMTHDLRTPLTAAKLSAQIIQKHPSDSKAILKFSTRIVENVERTDIMIRDLLDSLRLKAGEGISLNIQLDIMNGVLVGLVDELTVLHGKRFELLMTEMIKGYWDSNAIRRVIENLLSNAVKYGHPETPITVKLFKESSEICISVHNEGQAFTEEEKNQLFIPFKRLKNAKDSGQKGWGIGLSLVQGFVEAHEGSVQVESHEGSGTTFTVRFPTTLKSEAP